MDHNPYLQPGKHFVPRQGDWKRSAPHKGKWNLTYNGMVLTYNMVYGKCVNDRKFYSRHKDYKDNLLFKIVPCLA